MNADLNPGRFSISWALLKSDDSEPVLEIMSRCLIVRAEDMYVSARIEYTAYSADFEPISEGRVVPWYEWKITEERDPETGERTSLEVTAERVPGT